MIKKTLTIIIVTYDSEEYIEECVNSVFNSILINIEVRVVIVDNNSKDQTNKILKALSRKNKKIEIINNPQNIGFAKAVNIGIKKYPRCDYFLLLNPDTVLEKESIFTLINCSIKNSAGICGGSTFNNDGLETGSYFRKPNLLVGIFDFTNFRKLCIKDKWHKYFYYQDTIPQKTSFPVDIVTGGFMLINNDTINNIGFFDESYFMYLEDVDFCVKAKLKGTSIFHCYESRIKHIGGASSKNKDKVRHSAWMMSRRIYFFNHFNLFANCIIQPIFVIDDLLIRLAMRINNVPNS